MKYDDASWHYGGQFPADLPPAAGATHIGMFVAWAVLNGLASDELAEEAGDRFDALRDRTMTPGAWFIATCDEKFADADLSPQGNAFSQYYYGVPDNPALPPYLRDYAATFDGIDQIYHVEDAWANYDRIAPVISEAFSSWQGSRFQTPWRKRTLP